MMTEQSQTMGFMNGKHVYLRALEPEDLPYFRQWYNDPEIRGQIGEVLPECRKGSEDWLQRVYADKDRVWFAVVRKEDNKVIGETGLLRMYPTWRTTDLTLIIGDSEARGKGYGSEVMQMMLEYAFGYLNFHRVSIGVVGFNEKALRFYEKTGFRREGIQRDGYFYNHRYYDFVMMSILEDEYRQQYLSGR